jgi:MFS transporter, putative metabolite:H+ symporter
VFGQGGVFSLGAMCFVIAAAAVWVLGIETRGLALETLVSEAVETDGQGVLSPVRE